jgi:hypothetical protein
MTAPDALDTAPRLLRRRRRKRIILGMLLAFALVGTAYGVLIWFLTDRDLHEAIEQADRLDPGWRLEDLQNKRAEIPDGQNSALVVLKAARLLPTPWPRKALASQRLGDGFDRINPAQLLDAQQVEDLRTALAKAQDALKESRSLTELPNGRYPLESSPDILLPLRPHVGLALEIAALLSFDILLRAQEQDSDGALASCQALLNVGRSLGDEPGFDSPLIRMDVRSMATRKIERVLAQGQPSEARLVALQRLLEQEESEPLFLIGARGQRVAWERSFEVARSGNVTNNALQQALVPVAAYTSRPAILDLTTRIVEIAKLPVEKQLSGLKEAGLFLAKKRKEFPVIAWIYLVPRVEKITIDLGKGQARTQAEIRCAIAGLAAERYRRAQGDWPGSLAALVPNYLPNIPVDPFDAQPLRMRRLEKGVVIYSIGPDGQDSGGILIRPGKADAPGFRLWDKQHRRQPPKR